MVNGDGKYLALFHTGCLRKKAHPQKKKKKKKLKIFKNVKKNFLQFSFKLYSLRNFLTNH